MIAFPPNGAGQGAARRFSRLLEAQGRPAMTLSVASEDLGGWLARSSNWRRMLTAHVSQLDGRTAPYTTTIIVPAGTLPDNPAPPASGVYKLVTVLTHRNFGSVSDVWAVEEGPFCVSGDPSGDPIARQWRACKGSHRLVLGALTGRRWLVRLSRSAGGGAARQAGSAVDR